MYQSMFGAGDGAGAFATDMLILEDIREQERKAKEKAAWSRYVMSTIDPDEWAPEDNEEAIIDVE